MSDNGAVMLEAVRIVQQIGGEATALLTMIKRTLQEHEPTRPVRFEKPEEGGGRDASGYVRDHVWITSEARRVTGKPGKRPWAGELSLLLDFGRQDGMAADLGCACATVAWTADEDGWGFGGWFWDECWPPRREQLTLRADRLFWWIDTPEGAAEHLEAPAIESDWFYTLPLAALSDESKARQLLLNPALALLSGKPLNEAFLCHPEICRFAWSKDQDVPALAI